jgi:DNA repair photolyase
VLNAAGCSVAILTKGGTRCLDDADMLLNWPDGRVKVGATLTFMDADKSREWEPGAALPADRIQALAELHQIGVKTWASIEPVIDPSESLAIIRASLVHVDGYKIGRLNHMKNTTDWAAFGAAFDAGNRHMCAAGLP